MNIPCLPSATPVEIRPSTGSSAESRSEGGQGFGLALSQFMANPTPAALQKTKPTAKSQPTDSRQLLTDSASGDGVQRSSRQISQAHQQRGHQTAVPSDQETSQKSPDTKVAPGSPARTTKTKKSEDNPVGNRDATAQNVISIETQPVILSNVLPLADGTMDGTTVGTAVGTMVGTTESQSTSDDKKESNTVFPASPNLLATGNSFLPTLPAGNPDSLNPCPTAQTKISAPGDTSGEKVGEVTSQTLNQPAAQPQSVPVLAKSEGKAAPTSTVQSPPTPSNENPEQTVESPQVSTAAGAQFSKAAASYAKTVISPVPDAASRPRDPSHKISGAVSETNGTPVAITDKQMSRDDKQNEFAPPTEQFLPQQPVTAKATGKNLPKAATDIEIVGVSSPIQVDPADAASLLPPAPAVTDVPKTHEQAVAHLVNLVSNEVALIGRFKPDKLDVVLRPDSDTQISVQFHVTNGVINGTARCEHGNFALLSNHWADLQRTMEGQGVRLASLSDASTGGNSDQSQFNQRQNERQAAQSDIPEPFINRPAKTLEGQSALESAVLDSLNKKQLLQTWA